MKKLFVLALLGALITSTALAGVTAAKGPPAGKKTWICHLANSHKYVALQVGNQALAAHMRHGPDILISPAPASRAAAKTFCAEQTVLTPKRGGSPRTGDLVNAASPGVTADLRVRARLGQGQFCFTLKLEGATAATTLTISHNGSTVTTTPTLTSKLSSGATSTGCVTVSRDVVKQFLKNPADFTATATVTTAGGPVTLSATLTR